MLQIWLMLLCLLKVKSDLHFISILWILKSNAVSPSVIHMRCSWRVVHETCFPESQSAGYHSRFWGFTMRCFHSCSWSWYFRGFLWFAWGILKMCYSPFMWGVRIPLVPLWHYFPDLGQAEKRGHELETSCNYSVTSCPHLWLIYS